MKQRNRTHTLRASYDVLLGIAWPWLGRVYVVAFI